jgi:hypothetical protein
MSEQSSGSLLVDVVLLFGAGAALGVSAYYMAKSAAEITDVDKWEKDKNLREAHKWMTWAAVVGWVCVGLVILLLIIYIILVFSVGEYAVSWIVKGFLLLILASMAVAGSLSALGASQIRASPLFKEADQKGAYQDAIIGAVSALVGFVFIGGLFLWKLLYRRPDPNAETKKEVEQLEKQLVETKEAELKTKQEVFESEAKVLP